MPEEIDRPHKTETADTGAVRSKLYEMGFRFELRYDLMLDNDVAMRRIAEAFGEGFRKYPFRNWKRGFPESVYINHAFEHLRMHMTGDTSEDHIAHATWNLMSLMFTQERRPELLDLTNQPWPPAPMGMVCLNTSEPENSSELYNNETTYSVHFFPVKPTWHGEDGLEAIDSWTVPGWYIVESNPFSNILGNIPYLSRELALAHANSEHFKADEFEHLDQLFQPRCVCAPGAEYQTDGCPVHPLDEHKCPGCGVEHYSDKCPNKK